MRSKVRAHKVRQITIVSYIIHQLFKSNCIYLDREMTVNYLAISTFETLLFISYSN